MGGGFISKTLALKVETITELNCPIRRFSAQILYTNHRGGFMTQWSCTSYAGSNGTSNMHYNISFKRPVGIDLERMQNRNGTSFTPHPQKIFRNRNFHKKGVFERQFWTDILINARIIPLWIRFQIDSRSITSVWFRGGIFHVLHRFIGGPKRSLTDLERINEYNTYVFKFGNPEVYNVYILPLTIIVIISRKFHGKLWKWCLLEWPKRNFTHLIWRYVTNI